jgi:hypothetical protein
MNITDKQKTKIQKIVSENIKMLEDIKPTLSFRKQVLEDEYKEHVKPLTNLKKKTLPIYTKLCRRCKLEKPQAEMVSCKGVPINICLQCTRDEYHQKNKDKKKIKTKNHPWGKDEITKCKRS